MSNTLINFWRVKAVDMIVGRAVSSIAGLPGECVEFTKDGHYRVDIETPRPSVYHYRTESSENLSKLDIWIKGLESLTARCIYKIEGDLLTICVAGNNGKRPTDFLRNDDQLWCLIKLEHTKFQI